MTEEELFNKAETFYSQEGKELQAIEAYKELLDKYPDNINGWAHLSVMQNKIADFDGAIFSINRAIDISQNNTWIIKQKYTLLSLLSSFRIEGQIYFDES